MSRDKGGEGRIRGAAIENSLIKKDMA